ncbi:related to aldehyde dehydrogenase [Melanopsichium pennsylvanicum]|uniref:Related to aldehyde dehydrogenase n=2 Tax=Melanopsichium pennsylvanicum TaxID=63383 RepID=A0AAJ5C6C6_9BASI|nr:related to aldehyde dehydrogenase [Melanopsichium pennsylvanicum 4]SNX85681.1 related to aldehyde dehydrogenase [Melanopsichium pennsylvanicum]
MSDTNTPNFISGDSLPCIVDNASYRPSHKYAVYRTDQSSLTTRDVTHHAHSIVPADVETVIASSHAAFPAWRATPVSRRREIFLKAVSLLQSRIPEYAANTIQETVLSRGMAGFELAVLAVGHLQSAAESMTTALKSEALPTGDDGALKLVKREPYGVVLGIAPWNAAFILALRSVLYAIAAGNTAILKTSEYSPRAHLSVAQILIDAGLPKGVLNVVHVDPNHAPQVTEALIGDRRIRKVNFTGSTRVGKIIAATAAKYLKPVVLELGGKAPVLVLQDADLELAANGVLFGGYFNSNQVCMAVNNVLVHKSIAPQFEQVLRTMFDQHKEIFTAKLEQAMEDKHALRSLFTSASADRLKVLYQDAVDKGAKVIVGEPGFEGALVQPIVLSPVKEHMKIFTEETFGPVLSIVTFDNVDQAVEIANTPEYGLAASIYTKDQFKGLELADKIEAGQVHINSQPVHDDPAMPHGGWKSSGYGRFNGVEGVKEFTQTKGITLQQGHPTPFHFV